MTRANKVRRVTSIWPDEIGKLGFVDLEPARQLDRADHRSYGVFLGEEIFHLAVLDECLEEGMQALPVGAAKNFIDLSFQALRQRKKVKKGVFSVVVDTSVIKPKSVQRHPGWHIDSPIADGARVIGFCLARDTGTVIRGVEGDIAVTSDNQAVINEQSLHIGRIRHPEGHAKTAALNFGTIYWAEPGFVHTELPNRHPNDVDALTFRVNFNSITDLARFEQTAPFALTAEARAILQK